MVGAIIAGFGAALITTVLVGTSVQETPAANPAANPADPLTQLISDSLAEPVSPEPVSPEADSSEMAAPESGCVGTASEGGLLICRYRPGSTVTLGESRAIADAAGWVVLGIPRDAPEALARRVVSADTTQVVIDDVLAIAQRDYDLQRVDGVPQQTVTPDPSTLARRQREYAQKQAALASNWDGHGFLDGFIRPTEGRTTGVYGSQRIYNGTPGNPHWGLDWANVPGTPVIAPAGGRVVLAEPDMYYEGGLVFLDHGQGLVSAFLHMSAVHLAVGDIVAQGDLIGEIGAGGRTTGPHLDWRVKLRNGFYVDPALLLEMDSTAWR